MQSNDIDRSSHRETAQYVILLQLSAKNPELALRCLDDVSTLQLDTLLTVVFSQWAVSQMSEAINVASTLVGHRRDIAFRAILKARDDLPANEQRSIAIRLNREANFEVWVSERQASQSISEPQESWDILISDDVENFLQNDLLSFVAETLFETIGFSVLSKIYAEIDDYQIQLNLIKKFVRLDPTGALNYTLDLGNDRERSYMSAIVVQEWARTDARTALAAISTLEPPKWAKDLEREIAWSWARSKPMELIENIATLSEELRLKPLEIAFSRVANQNPLKAIASLSLIEDYVGNTTTILSGIVYQWASQRPVIATEWVLNNFSHEDSQRILLLEQTLPLLARQQPDQAFNLAMEQPASNTSLGLDYLVFQEVTRGGNLELVLKLLPKVRERSMVFAYNDLATALVEAGEPLRALELGKTIEEPSQRPRYYDRVFIAWTRTDPRDLYKNFTKLPSSETRAIAARELIRSNEFSPVLTEDEIEQVKTHLNSDDAPP